MVVGGVELLSATESGSRELAAEPRRNARLLMCSSPQDRGTSTKCSYQQSCGYMCTTTCQCYLYIHQFSTCYGHIRLQPPIETIPIFHLASSEQWCLSGGRGILTELSLCYSLVLCSISAMHTAQSLWAVLSGWSTGLGFDLIEPSSQSFKHLCIFGLYGAM